MDKDELLKILQDDEDGLLTVRPKQTGVSSDNRLLTAFQEITDFVASNGRLPEPNRSDIREMQLHSRLEGLRADPAKSEALRAHDTLGLLSESRTISSLEDLFKDDDDGLLADAAEEIFVLRNVPVPKELVMPEYIARRRPCADFSRFEALFKRCQIDLSSGKRKLLAFSKGSQIEVGDFFVLKGVLVFVADKGQMETTAEGPQARLRCIFENGTESDMLLRSLSRALYRDGLRVSTHQDKLFHTANDITNEDEHTGFIYVLQSLSQRPEIKRLANLYKIGFSRVTVEQRVRNAVREPTYLMAPVRIVSSFQCFNFNPQKLEVLLHHFFGRACLDVDVFDDQGHRYIPREWFIAPLPVITRAVEMVISGQISEYEYDCEKQLIVRRASR